VAGKFSQQHQETSRHFQSKKQETQKFGEPPVTGKVSPAGSTNQKPSANMRFEKN